MNGTDAVGGLVRIATGAAWWGAELDPRYRVLALTIEPTGDGYPAREVPADARLQVLLHPVNAITLTHRRDGDLVPADVEDLLPVVERLEGAPVTAAAMLEPGPWAVTTSLAGRSDAPDGRTHGLWLRARTASEQVDLHVTFDEVEIRRPDGTSVPLAG